MKRKKIVSQVIGLDFDVYSAVMNRPQLQTQEYREGVCRLYYLHTQIFLIPKYTQSGSFHVGRKKKISDGKELGLHFELLALQAQS